MAETARERPKFDLPQKQNTLMKSFRRSYLVSTTILCLIAVLSALSSIGSQNFSISYTVAALLIALVTLLPTFRGGIIRNRKLSISISCSMAVGSAILLGFVFRDFVRTKGGEGPKGEGSPLELILAMTFFASLFVAPWLITSIRGLCLWNQRLASDINSQ